jgi:hypothetical protein
MMVLLSILSLTKESFNYMNHKSKCYDCEKQILQTMGPSYVWMAQPAKSFDAEREAVIQSKSPEGGYLAKTIKYY